VLEEEGARAKPFRDRFGRSKRVWGSGRATALRSPTLKPLRAMAAAPAVSTAVSAPGGWLAPAASAAVRVLAERLGLAASALGIEWEHRT